MNVSLYQIAHVEVYSGHAFGLAEITVTLLRLLRKPVVLTLHGGNLPSFSRRWPGRVRRMLRAAVCVTTPSHHIASALAWVRPDIHYLPNGIDLSAYSFVQRTDVRPKLVWLRAFHQVYDPMMAAKAISLLVDEFPNIELTMFGPDKDDGSLQALQDWANEARIEDRLHIPGAIPKKDVPQALARHDIFLNTTTAESFGVSVMEAASLGMCIVTTNVGELSHIWTNEYDALLVPPDNPEAMAGAIRRILTEPELTERLSRNARSKAEQFDWSMIVPQWESLFRSIMPNNS